MNEPDERFLLAVLDEIEQREARLLTWGLVDGFVSASELTALIEQLLDVALAQAELSFFSAAPVISELRTRALLFDIGETPDQQFRSRMAETVRLLFRLRQLFPKHQGGTGWQDAPTLVADFRFLWRRREYPARTIRAPEAAAAVSEATSDVRAKSALEALIESFGADFALARFQVRAAERIMSGFGGEHSIGTLVSAGTGSGKTLAFYLPALARIASHIQADTAGERWVKALALYPRSELLKDQFAEVYGQARRLDGLLSQAGRRKILIATLFNSTPATAAYVPDTKGWRAHPRGFVCSFIACPEPQCSGEMIWPETDRLAERETLVCVRCGRRIADDEVILTRKRMENESPDILFTTTEMLNQRLGDKRTRHLFGVGDRCRRPVELMLLDEVHTYAGAAGAQVAFLLRRWRKLLGSAVNFVGLSATLKDGAPFFSRLTGLNELAAQEIAPSRDEMIKEGAEYLLALRGDPVSRTALLSTTIQTAMLMSRALDAPDRRRSQGAWGERTFLFTDDIDVTNRMYFAVLDAEGRDSDGRFDMVKHPNGGLATLRRPMPSQQRKLHGQDWSALIEIGHSLQAQDRKAVGRVMSLDPGVDPERDIVVATASLEVGYNDPLVGAVIQHKAPRDIAQFLQRKGRAGRSRLMRPWTVTVLSDYGRDRIAYQGYDALFDPELPVRSLPTGNRYVRRIQAGYATLDYLSQQYGFGLGSVWKLLSGPSNKTWDHQRQVELKRAISRILGSPTEQERYANYLRYALKLPPEEIEVLLWEHPRPLLTQVLPTALRRLETNWGTVRTRPDYQVKNSPLPEFVPANLFSDLNLPEVEIVPQSPGSTTPDSSMMPILQAMREFAPGRVSRRFGVSYAYERYWLAPTPDQNPTQAMDIGALVQSDPMGDWRMWDDAGVEVAIPVFRPRAMSVQRPPGTLVDTSNARLRWRSQIIAQSQGLVFHTPSDGNWERLIPQTQFFTHQGRNPVRTRRMAVGSDADLRFRNGTSLAKRFEFEAGAQPAALGFELTVDALCLRLSHSQDLWSSLGPQNGARQRALRTARFHHEATHGQHLSMVDNVFARQWLAQLLLAAISHEAIAKDISLEAATDNLAAGRANLDLEQTLGLLFRSPVVDAANGVGNQQDRLRQDLAAQLAEPQVVTGLFQLATILWSPIDANWEPWLREKYAATVGAATMAAIISLCPEIDGDGLVVDISAGPKVEGDVFAGSEMTEVWISESAPGGNGQIEDILKHWAEDPARFFSLLTACVGENDFSLNDIQIRRLLEQLEADPGGRLAACIARYRRAYGCDESHEAFKDVRTSLAAAGYSTFHAFIVAVANRVVRPGSSPQSDAFILRALREWDRHEERLGVELDARVIAYHLAGADEIDAALALTGIDAPMVDPRQWRFGAIYALLWPRGAHMRQAGLQLYSPFADLPAPEPLLVTARFGQGAEPIDLLIADWSERCLAALGERGVATLRCPIGEAERLADAFAYLATNPVHTDYLSVFCRVKAVRRVDGDYLVDLDIAEARL